MSQPESSIRSMQRTQGLRVGALALLLAPWAVAATAPAPQITPEGPYPSATPKYRFAETLEEQEAQLADNPLMRRFAASRARFAADRYRPVYHFVSPESSLGDPNGLTFWQGRWHLFYQGYPPDEFPDPQNRASRRQHWGHAVSEDLVHWRDLPYAIYPGIEKLVFSGSTVVEKDRVVAFYPGIGAPGKGPPGYLGLPDGQMVAVSRDPLLLNWEKSAPVDTDVGDSSIWKEGDAYYGLVGGLLGPLAHYDPGTKVPFDPLNGPMGEWYRHGVWPQGALWTSRDLVNWSAAGNLLINTPLTGQYDEMSCPNFERIGDKYILTFFSHKNGGQYLLGEYDQRAHQFRPYEHGRFNHGQVAPGGVGPPSSSEDGKGGVINILNVVDGRKNGDWDQIMTLPQRLTLGDDRRLRLAPVEALQTLREDHRHVGQTVLPAGQEVVLKSVRGNAMELEVEIDPQSAHWVQLNVLRSPKARELTSITFYNYDPKLNYWWLDTPAEVVLDGSRSSTLADAWPRPPERAQLRRAGEPLKLRVFVDRSVVEVYVNNKQYLAMRVYPGRSDSVGVSLRAHGQDALLKSLDAWRMKPIWPTTTGAGS